MRLLKLTGVPAKQVYSTLGCEQEYFLLNQLLCNLRPDIIQTGRTLFGSSSPKGQELQDHYLGSLKDRVLDYMRDFEESAFEVGIPVKTRHNEVAPSQFEVAPSFERSSIAVDHNILLMDLMTKTALEHGLVCLLHEKPFAPINGSGKHCNWSLSTDGGKNLLSPTDVTEGDLHFLILLTAILQAIHRHAGLLRASIATASNDHRLGGHEAPPAIISVYLGEELEAFLNDIERGKTPKFQKQKGTYDLGLRILPPLPKDSTDRNRTSPFAFTGNKFEFRAVGSSANPASAITVLNCITAEALDELLGEIEPRLKKGESLLNATLEVVRRSLTSSKPIRFNGDNYTKEWEKEAAKRKLPIMPKSIDSFGEWKKPATIKVYEGVLTKAELESRYEITLEGYSERVLIEFRCALDILQTQVIPVAVQEQAQRAKALHRLKQVTGKAPKAQLSDLQALSDLIEDAITIRKEMIKFLQEVKKMPLEKKAKTLSSQGCHILENARAAADALEKLVNDDLWPLPKYRELLFIT
jgi:glutamine synthetase